MRNLLNSLIIICFVLASVSPACKFISGKGLMEICAADGSIQEMQIPEELLAYLPADADVDNAPQEHRDMMQDCGFCFAQSNLSAFLTDTPGLVILPLDRDGLDLYQSAYARHELRLYQPRGPPAFLA